MIWICPLVALETPAPRLMALSELSVTPLGPERAPAAEVVIDPAAAVKFRVEAVAAAVVEILRPAMSVRPPLPVPVMAEETTTSR